MSKFGAWVPALVMLAAGFAGGYLFGSGEGSSQVPLSLEADGGGDATQPAPTRDLAATGDDGPALATTAERAALRAALEQLPAPEIPRGTGVITGVVKTEEGTALAGVTVKATPRYPPDDKPGARKRWEEQPIEEIVRSTVARYWWQRQSRKEVLTGADGTFRFEGLTSGNHQVTSEHDDYMIHPVDHQMAWQAKPGAHIEFRARVVVPVTIEILLPDGTAPEQAQANFKSSGSNWGMAWSRQNKTLKQKPGTYQLEVNAGASGEYKAEPQTVVLKLGEPQSLTVQLTARPVLRGNIVYPEGEAFERTQVYLLRLAAGEQPDATGLKSSSQNTWVHRGFRSGTDFSFKDLSPGRYALGVARASRGDIVVMEVVQVVDGVTEQDLQIPALTREEYAVVHVTGPDGEPVPDAQVGTGYRSKRGSHSGGASSIKRPDGSLWILHPARGQAKDPTVEYFITVTSPSYGSLEEAYALSSSVELSFRFRRPATLTLRVAGVAGTRYEGRVQARLHLKTGEGDQRRSRSSGSDKLDATGKLIQLGLQPGTYEVELVVTRERRGSSVLRESVELDSGENALSLKLPELMIVTITGAERSVSVREKTGERGARRFSTYANADAQGRAVFDALPPGTYTAHSGRKKAEFTLPGPSEVELR